MLNIWQGYDAQLRRLQRKLDAEKAQRIADISRTTHTHANLLAEANQRIKHLEVCPHDTACWFFPLQCLSSSACFVTVSHVCNIKLVRTG